MEITITYRRGEVPMTKWDDAFQRQLECRLGETTGGQPSVQRRLLAAQSSLVDALQEIVGCEPFTLKLVVTGEAPRKAQARTVAELLMRAPVPTDGLLEGTPFKQIRARRAFDYCCVCRKRIGKGDCCYKPAKNEGGYKPEARICPPCFADKLSRQTREGN